MGVLVRAESLGIDARVVTNRLTLGGLKVVVHAVVEGEDGGGSTNFGTHVTDGTHTSAGEGVDTVTVVLNDGTSATLDSENTSNLKDDIYATVRC